MTDETHPLLHVAIIGSGPAGYYAAEELAKHDHVRVDILDRLPTPYGLIRGGVAPDHQSIKGVFRRYEKTNLAENAHFVGNLEVGRDVSLADLKDLYDAVILAVGAPKDRILGIPGDDKKGVVGSAEFVGWYNSHPSFEGLDIDLDIETVAVIGNGNVAVDVVRVLAKTPSEMAISDLAPYAAEKIHAAPIKDLYMLGRRGPLEAKFSPKELGELGELENCVTLMSPDQLPNLSDEDLAARELVIRKNYVHLQSFTEIKPEAGKKTLHLKFYAMPVEVLGDDKVTGLKLEKTTVDEKGRGHGTGETFILECQLVVPCIGYNTIPLEGAKFREDWGCFDNDEGKIEDRLYVTGWARRGPTGTIGTNRGDGQGVANRVLEEVKSSGKPGRAGLDALVKDRKLEIVTFREWKKIEAAEEASAADQAPRQKFHKIEDMVKTAKS
ncbi:MAG: FAD-dependent oxidoreductase [Sphingomonadales bacterium]